MGLESCGSCGCPVKAHEAQCPFCGTNLGASRAGGLRSAAAAAMGLATAVTVGVSTGGCGSSVVTDGSGGAGGTPAVTSDSSSSSTSMMMGSQLVAAYGPPPSFCEESPSTSQAVGSLGDFCYGCAEFSCCPEMEACGNDCANCLDGETMCATPGGQLEADNLLACLGQLGCAIDCGLTEVCDSGLTVDAVDCAECLSASCCMQANACAADANCVACLQNGDASACGMTMNDDLALDCQQANCAPACQ